MQIACRIRDMNCIKAIFGTGIEPWAACVPDKLRIHKAHKVGAHFMLGFWMTSLHGSCGLFNSL